VQTCAQYFASLLQFLSYMSFSILPFSLFFEFLDEENDKYGHSTNSQSRQSILISCTVTTSWLIFGMSKSKITNANLLLI